MLYTYSAVAWAVVVALTVVAVSSRRRAIDLVTVLLWGAIVAVGTALALFVGQRYLGLGRFGGLNIMVRQLLIGVPLAAALLTLRAARRGWRDTVTGVGLVAVVGGLLLAPLGFYATMIEPNTLVVREQAVPLGEIPVNDSIRIAVIADIQTSDPGPHEQAAVAAVMAAEPDLIMIAGDLFQGPAERFEQRLPALRDLLRPLAAPGGVYIVEGDSDSRARLTEATKGTDVRSLFNEVATVELRGVALAVGGVRLAYWEPAAQRAVADLARTPAQVRILLAHRPDAVGLVGPADRISLTVAGHTHGGQVQIPFIGPLMTASDVPRSVAAGGLHIVDGNLIYVSTGVGVERNQAPRIRFGVPPSVSLLTLENDPAAASNVLAAAVGESRSPL
ncbi:MAG: metallophosphoesterase [Candidatus Nanopelagicales bacterium]